MMKTLLALLLSLVVMLMTGVSASYRPYDYSNHGAEGGGHYSDKQEYNNHGSTGDSQYSDNNDDNNRVSEGDVHGHENNEDSTQVSERDGRYPENHEFNYRQMHGYPVHVGNGHFEFLGIHGKSTKEEAVQEEAAIEKEDLRNHGYHIKQNKYHLVQHYNTGPRQDEYRTPPKPEPAQHKYNNNLRTKSANQGYHSAPNPQPIHPVYKHDTPDVMSHEYHRPTFQKTEPIRHQHNTKPQAIQPGYHTVPKPESIRHAYNTDKPQTGQHGYRTALKQHPQRYTYSNNPRPALVHQGYHKAPQSQPVHPQYYPRQRTTSYYSQASTNPYQSQRRPQTKVRATPIQGKYYTKVITKHGDASHTPRAGDLVSVWYKGMFTDGSVFDTNIGKVGRGALKFRVGTGQVIRGWDEVLLTMGVGEKATVTIQPDGAYGKAGKGGRIPPNSVLVFEMELESIN